MGGIRAPLGLGIAALRSRFGGVADFVNRHACGRGITTALAVLLVGAGCVFGQSWKNQGEFDLYTAITKEADAHKKLELLDQWRAKYPESEFQRNRLSFYINVYQQLKDNRKIVETLEEIEALAPKDDEVKKGLMLFILECNNPDPFFLASGERAATSLIGGGRAGAHHARLGGDESQGCGGGGAGIPAESEIRPERRAGGYLAGKPAACAENAGRHVAGAVLLCACGVHRRAGPRRI
jgi:hypothetical protein